MKRDLGALVPVGVSASTNLEAKLHKSYGESTTTDRMRVVKTAVRETLRDSLVDSLWVTIHEHLRWESL